MAAAGAVDAAAAGDVYLTVTDFLKTHPDFETMKDRLVSTGLVAELGLNNTVATVFAPTGRVLYMHACVCW